MNYPKPKHLKLTAFVFAVLLSAPRAEAVELPELTHHLEAMLETTGEAVASCESESAEDAGGAGDRWYYRRFWLRFRPKVSFAVPGFAKLEIIPEIEMLWQRDLPEGWEVYRPRN